VLGQQGKVTRLGRQRTAQPGNAEAPPGKRNWRSRRHSRDCTRTDTPLLSQRGRRRAGRGCPLAHPGHPPSQPDGLRRLDRGRPGPVSAFEPDYQSGHRARRGRSTARKLHGRLHRLSARAGLPAFAAQRTTDVPSAHWRPSGRRLCRRVCPALRWRLRGHVGVAHCGCRPGPRLQEHPHARRGPACAAAAGPAALRGVAQSSASPRRRTRRHLACGGPLRLAGAHVRLGPCRPAAGLGSWRCRGLRLGSMDLAR